MKTSVLMAHPIPELGTLVILVSYTFLITDCNNQHEITK